MPAALWFLGLACNCQNLITCALVCGDNLHLLMEMWLRKGRDETERSAAEPNLRPDPRRRRRTTDSTENGRVRPVRASETDAKPPGTWRAPATELLREASRTRAPAAATGAERTAVQPRTGTATAARGGGSAAAGQAKRSNYDERRSTRPCSAPPTGAPDRDGARARV